MNAVEISVRAQSGHRLELRGEPKVLRAFLTLLERELEIRVGGESPELALPRPEIRAPPKNGLLPCPDCPTAWKNRLALGVHRAHAHPAGARMREARAR